MDSAFRLGDWLVEPRLNTLASGGREIRVEPKVMAVLLCLADQAGEVVAKEQLMRTVWPDAFVTDDVLTHAVSELRKAFADDARTPRFIQTIPKGGYRLIARVARATAALPSGNALAPPAPSGTGQPKWRRAVAIGSIVLFVIAAAWLWRSASRREPPRVMRLAIDVQSTGPLVTAHTTQLPSFRLSPDGTRMAFVVGPQSNNRLYLRALDQLEPTPIPGTEGGFIPFFSPDGAGLGFAAKGRLKKVSLSDGTLVDLGAAPSPRGATWTRGNAIVFAPSFNGGLWQVPAAGGAPVQLTAPDRARHENSHRWPEALPDGQHVIFTVRRGGDTLDSDIEALDLRTRERRLVVKGGSLGQYLSSGHLVYGSDTALLAIAFDPIGMTTHGPPSRVVEGVITAADTGVADFSVSDTGSLAYIPKARDADQRRLVWVDEHGLAEDLVHTRAAYDTPRLSPDGRQVAVTVSEGSGSNVWIYDVEHGSARRVTSGRRDGWPVWDPDGQHLAISTATAEARNVVSWDPAVDQSTPPLVPSEFWQWPTGFSPDGRELAYTEYGPATLPDVWILERESGRRRPLVATPGVDTGARFSPDGRWVAYVSDETGTPQVYVRPYPDGGPAVQVSPDGGDQPVWSPSDVHLFYRNGDRMMSVAWVSNPARAGKARLVFEGVYRGALFNHAPGYDVAAGGRRFVMIKDNVRAVPRTEVTIVVNWADEVARQVPAKPR